VKRLIEVTTPGNGKTYEFLIDSGIGVAEARKALILEILEFENGALSLDYEDTILCTKQSEKRLPDDAPLFTGAYGDNFEFLLL